MADESLLQEKPIKTWRGGKDQLLRLGEVMDRQFVELCHKAEQSAVPTWNTLIPWRKRRLIGEIRSRYQVILEVTDQDKRIVKDTFSEALRNNELTGIHKITFNCSVDDQSCTLTLTTNGANNSSLTVQGPPAWARQAFAELSRTLRHSRPWWTWMWLTYLQTIVGMTLVAAVIATSFVVVDDSGPFWWTEFIILGVAALLPWFLLLVLHWLFPAISVKEEGAPDTRRQVGRIVGGLVGAAVTILTITTSVISVINRK